MFGNGRCKLVQQTNGQLCTSTPWSETGTQSLFKAIGYANRYWSNPNMIPITLRQSTLWKVCCTLVWNWLWILVQDSLTIINVFLIVRLYNRLLASRRMLNADVTTRTINLLWIGICKASGSINHWTILYARFGYGVELNSVPRIIDVLSIWICLQNAPLLDQIFASQWHQISLALLFRRLWLL